MAKTSKTQLLTSSAIAGVAIMQLAPAVQAQENFGIRNQQPELLEVVVNAGETVEGNIIGVFADTGPVTVTNNGSIRGNGFNGGSLQSLPGGGVVIAQGGSSVTNLGDISGAQFGITTISYLDPATGQFQSRAIGTTVVNSGSISGEQDDGVRLIGGGVVKNSGTISGTGSEFADGVSMFPFTDQANENYSALVENGATGSITGQRFGVILSAGGDVANDGAIAGGTGGVFIQGTALNVAEGEDRSGLTASVTNTGTISGTGDFGFGGTNGYGVGFGGDLATATLVNSGTITSAFNRGVFQGSLADLVITNEATGRIEGATSGIYGGSNGSMTIINAGVIRGNGTYDGLDASPDAGITIATANSSVTNSGTISGAGGGITTAFAFNATTNQLLGLAVGTVVTNTGTIAGESNDGVRLIGGGSVVNSGAISGTGGTLADGISMFAYTDQAIENYSASVENSATGTITGQRFGMILSGGGDVANAGTVTGGTGGVLMQSGPFNLTGGEVPPGQIANVTNTGTISGTGDFGFGGILGYGVAFAGALETASLVNSGTITSAFNRGVTQGSLAALTVTNEATGRIEGATSGIYSAGGSITVVNAGVIRGNGTYDGFDASPDAGITIASADSSVSNSGTISGAGGGITTAFAFNATTSQLLGLAVGTVVTNTGTIAGESNDGVRLIGGGSVVNSGAISGTGGTLADGISMFAYTDQVIENYSASVENAAGGTITGQRFGMILSGGGDVANAGTVTGGTGGVLMQSGPFNLTGGEVPPGQIANVTNTGTISGTGNFGFGGILGYGVGFAGALETASLVNSGTITSTFNRGVTQGSLAALTVTNEATGRIEGATSGIYSAGGSITVVNAGVIRGNGTYDGFDASPDAGITIASAGSSVTNSGTISGAGGGITTAFAFNAATNELRGLAVGTVVTNTGTIAGESNDGVRLIGGGVVQNSGAISGTGSTLADGISMFAYTDQAIENYSASVENAAGGTITGQRFGMILSGGGDVANAGTVTGGTGGVLMQSGPFNLTGGEVPPGQIANVTNTGTISGTGNFGFGGILGYGVGFAGALETASLVNSGTITSTFHAGVAQRSSAALTITNEATGRIEGGTSGVLGLGSGSLTLVNAGVIRGNGTYDGFDAAPDAGVNITAAGSSVTNSGTIAGAGSGITTAFVPGPQAGEFFGRAIGTLVTNTGTIAGESNDGVRLIGGGSVVNSGAISGTGGTLADGISMFAYTDQAIENYSASVENSTTGTITGQRFGIILSGGGDVSNDGTITGGNGGVLMQSGPFNLTGGAVPPGQTATVTNTGTINATGDFGVNGILGYGVGFAGALETASLVNSGTITSAFNAGVRQGSAAALAITNEATGRIEGATSGIVVSAGSLDLTNAGTIRGNGVAANLQAAPEAGVRLQAGENLIANSGTISGAQFGIVTTQLFNPTTQTLEWLVGRTQVVNSGTIRGEANDGIALIGGGIVRNSGTITGTGSTAADGVQIQFYPGVDSGESEIGIVTNQTGATITGDRYGIILAGGGLISNAGTISGGTNGVALVSQNFPGKIGTLINIGTINGGLLVDVDLARLENVGTINNANGAGILIEGGRADVINSGRISGNGVAIQFSAGDDQLILNTGSRIEGLSDGAAGFDRLVLEGSILELTADQAIGDVTGFESLAITVGYWNKTGSAGTFDSVVIGDGAALQINEAAVAGQAPVSSLVAPAITNNGRLVLNFSDDAALTQLGSTPIAGTGSLQLTGEGVLTVAGSALTYTGGTTVSNGGLVLTGTLPGDVTTEGDGFFQLGNGGTEGTFAGNLVNNGRFIFNRSGDYDFVGNFSGTGVLDKLGTGVLVFLGDYDFRGTTNILAGSVRIAGVIDPTTEFNLGSGGTLDISGNDQTIAALSGEEEAQVELGSQTLNVTQQENTTFAGEITGTGGIVKDGDGLLNLTGDSTFTGPTAVNGGTLAVNGSIISPVTVNEGGTLGGNGSVGSTTVTSGGAIAPGNSIGRLTVNGDLAFAAGSIYEVEVNAAGQADRIDATGRVTIASTAQMAILAENGTYSPRTDYVVLTGAQGVTGTFGTVTTDLAFLTPFLRYGANAVTLSLYRNDISFAAVAANPNQAGVAGAVQALGINNPLFETVLVQNAATAQATFADLSGEIHASTIAGLTDDSRHLRNAMLGMAAPQQSGAFLWGSAFGSWGEFDSSATNFGMEADHRGFATGVGYGGEGFGIAVSAGLGGSDFALDGRADASDVSSTYLALHGSFALPGGFRGAAGVSYAWHDVVTNRAVGGALAQSLTASRDAKTWQLFGEVGYTLALGSTAITPFARLAHVSTDSDGFTEVGGNAALTVGDVDQKTTFLSLGARAEFGAADAKLKPYASAAWNRAFGDRNAAAVSRLTGNAPAFTVSGLTIPQDSAELEAGLSYTAGRLNLGAGYVGTLAGDRNTHGARLTARFSF